MKYRWPLTPLGEILTERREVPSSEDIESGRIRIVEKISFDSGRIQLRLYGSTKTGMILIQPGDLLVSGINAAKGAIAIYDESAHEPIAATIHYGAYIPKRDRVSVQFLWRMLRSRFFQDLLLEFVPGGIKTELKAKRFLPVPVPLPPLAEQRRIVKRIEELAAQINGARTLRQQAAEETEALVRSAARLKIESVDCELTTLLECLDKSRDGIQTGPFGAQLRSDEFLDAGRPVLTIGNVQFKGLNTTDLMYVSELKAAELVRYRVCEGDILFARMGTVGRCCVVPALAHGWLINYHIIRVALDRNSIDPRFIHWTIQTSPDIEQYLNDKIRGATRKGVNSKIVAGLPLRIPPLPEQRRIVAELDALQAEVDALKRLQAETAAEIDALLPSILDRAFKGEL